MANSNSDEYILINTIYTGDYTNENIGHEIINLYKTDIWIDEKTGQKRGGKNYIYISPWGKVAKDKHETIKEVIFVRAAGKDKLEIIGCANGLTYWGKDQIKDRSSINTIKTDIDNILNNAKKNYRKEFKFDTYENVENFINFAFDKIKQKIKDDIKKEALDNSLEIDLRISKDNFRKLEQDAKTSKNKEKELHLINSYKSRIEKEYVLPMNEYIHNLQLEYIKQNKIEYNGTLINKVFEDNYHYAPPIYLTFKAKSVKKVNKSIVIDYGHKEIKEILNKSKGKNVTDENTKDVRLRNQSCLYYMSQNDLRQILEKSNNGFYNENNWEDTTELRESTYRDDEETFIDIIRKPYDELVFSNMIAYFFEKDKNLFRKFCKYLLDLSKKNESEININRDSLTTLEELNINKTYEISREVKVDKGRIDILIRTDDSLFIIENKIKSDINGKEHDPYTGEYSDQLINYYNHFNKDVFDEDFKNIKHQYYFIFTPNYNKIDKKRIKETIKSCENISVIDKSCKIIDLYNIITYKYLYNFFSTNKPRQFTTDKQKVYFEDFINSLEKHSHSCDDVIERRMENEFRQKTTTT